MPDRVDPRRLAFDVLVDVELHGAYSDASLGRALSRYALAADDRRLASRLVYGVLAEWGRLDHTIRSWARRSVDERVAIALRLGLFQITCLERIPAYAAVDTTVALVRRFAPHAAGFVNALLRRATREGLASVPRDEPERSAVRFSHPAWLVELWRRELGAAEADALMVANNEAAPTILRALVSREHALRALAERGIDAEPAAYAPDAVHASVAVAIPGTALPQGEASQLVVRFLAPDAGMRVLDACAAPGGKAAYLAKLVGESGSVTAVDCAPAGGARIRALCRRAGVHNVEIVGAAIEDAGDLGTFDAVLVDAPCSGLGTLREHPEIRWRRTPHDLEDLAQRQSRILAAAAAHLRPGGALVYSTCTISPLENDAVVEAFVAEHADFRELGDRAPVHPAVAPFLDARGRLRTFPHRHDMSGFFAARLIRS